MHCEIPLGFVTAAVGGDVEVPTLKGPVKLTIPAETQTGKAFRLRGKGIKGLRGSGIGDLICRVFIETPVNLTDEQVALLRQLDELLASDSKRHNPKAKGWFDSVKSFFQTD